MISGQLKNNKKNVCSMSSTPEPALWSCETGLWIPCFAAMLCDLVVKKAHEPAKHAAGHDGHENLNAWFPYFSARTVLLIA